MQEVLVLFISEIVVRKCLSMDVVALLWAPRHVLR